MGGGNWTAQNKARAGAYINVKSNNVDRNSGGIRGVVTLPWVGDFGSNDVLEITSRTDFLRVLGRDIDAPEMLTIRETLKRATTILLMRVNSEGGTKARAETPNGLVITAKHTGSRGNAIRARIIDNVDNPSVFTVQTLIDTTVVDSQSVTNLSELVANDLVEFVGNGVPEPLAGISLTGGVSAVPDVSDYAHYFETMENYEFNVMALPITTSRVRELGVAFIKRQRNDEGKKCQLVLSGSHEDNEAIINVGNGVILADGTEIEPYIATCWVAGASAGAGVGESNTYTEYDGAVDVTERFSNSAIVNRLEAGEYIFTLINGRIVVEQDINSLITFTQERSREFSKNTVLRTLDYVSNGIRSIFARSFIGQVTNNENGRDILKSAIIEFLEGLQDLGAIENFGTDDIQIEPGRDKDTVIAQLNIQPTDAIEKLYMTVEMQ